MKDIHAIVATPGPVCAMGFSAGGHLVASTVTSKNVLDAQALIYPCRLALKLPTYELNLLSAVLVLAVIAHKSWVQIKHTHNLNLGHIFITGEGWDTTWYFTNSFLRLSSATILSIDIY